MSGLRRSIHIFDISIRTDTIMAMKNVFQSTEEFDDWLDGLKDHVAKARVFNRIDAATLGNFGECEPVGEGVSEMKIHVGPGYRVYYTRIGLLFICCWLVVINPPRRRTSNVQLNLRVA